MKNPLLNTLLEVLKQDTRFISHEWELLKNTIRQKAEELDSELISLIIENEKLREEFFIDIKEYKVFNASKFIKFINNKEFLPDSYTSFKNKIWLTDKKGNYLAESNEVVLSFPYKDCVLAGGQDKEDTKRNEVFYNEILGRDEIDRLLDDKVFTNFKRIDKDWEYELGGFKRDAEINKARGLSEDTITDNLIIKWNNLLALHSLKKNFAGKVKLIYIDPPYNTGNDSFWYNDKFNHSTWLTFMKNRLEIAKELLKEDGVIFVQCDDNEQAYLKILMDEVFNDNFINHISIKTKSPSGFKTVNLWLFETAEYIYIYWKNKKESTYNLQYVSAEYDKNYKYFISNFTEDFSKWEIEVIDDIISKNEWFDNVRMARKELGKEIFKEKCWQFAIENKESVFRFTEINSDASKDTLDFKSLSIQTPWKILRLEREWNLWDRYILDWKEIYFYSKKVKEIDGVITPTMLLSNIWTDIAYEWIAKEWWVVLKKGKKPEKLLRRVINMFSSDSDIVLDYHLWSGTTCAVSHKMWRQYIWIEQLNYWENDSTIRLQNVIKGDSSGISKIISWKGGWEFVYMEIMEQNGAYMERINWAKSSKELVEIWEDVKESWFVNYYINTKSVDENMDEFQKLSIEEQKTFLMEILDKNLLYMNYSEMRDENNGITTVERDLNDNFYKG